MLLVDMDTRPQFRSKCIANGHISDWDGEWYYHFLAGGYDDVEWFELRGNALRSSEILKDIVEIGFVGDLNDGTLRLYGYAKNGTPAKKFAIK